MYGEFTWRWRNAEAAYGSPSRPDILRAARKIWPEDSGLELREVFEEGPGVIAFWAGRDDVFVEVRASDRELSSYPARSVHDIARMCERKLRRLRGDEL